MDISRYMNGVGFVSLEGRCPYPEYRYHLHQAPLWSRLRGRRWAWLSLILHPLGQRIVW
jgi:hypothetical protein